VSDVPGQQTTKAQLEMTLDVMAHSLVYWVQDLHARGLLGEGSHVFAMTSSGGTRVMPFYGAVSAAKAALESHVRQLALELGPAGVSVNAIRAGVTDTPASRKIPAAEYLFQEARRILRAFIHEEGVVDHRNVLAVEKEFLLPVGEFQVLGYIDRVDWVDDETALVSDYKSNRLLFTREEVDTSLQLSLYAIAAQRIWPWAKKVKLSFWMLRHAVKQETLRTPEQLADALAYVEVLGRQMETATDFPPRLGPNCAYCDHRHQCPAYAAALEGKREFICANPEDLEAVARERQEVAYIAKVAYARKEELDEVIKARLADAPELVLAGVRYAMTRNQSFDYPIEPTVSIIAEALGQPHEKVFEKLATVDKKAFDNALRSLARKMGKARLELVKAELQAHAAKSYSPRLWAKEVA